MAFKKIEAGWPTRQWSLVGLPETGKSTFAAQMRGPLLVVDADHRFTEVAKKTTNEIYEVSDNPADNVDAEAVVAAIKDGMTAKGAPRIGTIVVDSLTAIIAPLVSEAMLDNEAGRNKNRVSAFKDKAMAMRHLQDGITGRGTDTLWIYHIRDTLGADAQKKQTTSISAVELARLRRSLNVCLSMVIEGRRRGIRVDWARNGRSGMTIWDDTDSWIGMPEKIEQAIYGGLTTDEMNAMATKEPTKFSGPQEAIAWGHEQECFNDAMHAQNAYEELKREQQPKSAQEMWTAWIAEVKRRKAEKEAPAEKAVKERAPSTEPIQIKVQDENGLVATINEIFAAEESARGEELATLPDNSLTFVANPIEDYVFDVIAHMDSTMIDLSNSLSQREAGLERPMEYEPIDYDRQTALCLKLQKICGFADEEYREGLHLSEVLLRTLAQRPTGPLYQAFAVELNTKITPQIAPPGGKLRDNPKYDPATVATIKRIGQLVKEPNHANGNG